MINRRTLNLHLASREVTLEVLHIRSGVPQAPLFKREEFQLLYFAGCVLQCQFLYFCQCFQGYEEENTGFHTVLAACDAGVAHTVAALVEIEWRLAGLPSGIPHAAIVVDVEVASAVIHRHIIVAIARDAAELGIFVE